ncbi:hypothetical protein ACLBR5_32725 [Escherichia coli]
MGVEDGEGKSNLNVKHSPVSRRGDTVVPVSLPAMNLILGKTVLTTPAGREGLAPQIMFGKGIEDFSLVWAAQELQMLHCLLRVRGGVGLVILRFSMQRQDLCGM